MDGYVVSSAQKDQIDEAGDAAEGPVNDVVIYYFFSYFFR